jgi:FG-GAP repeat
MTNNMLVVGAPFVVSPGTTTPVGAVYVYGYFGENNTTENTFQPFGNSTLFSGSGIFAAYEEFGSSVSVNEDNSFIVVGAPKSSTQVLNATGRFYIYQLNGLGTSWDMIFNQTGSVANGYFGTSVDISNDGSHCVVGAPFAENRINMAT